MDDLKALQLGVGTFVGRTPNDEFVWISVNKSKTREVWALHSSWPTGLETTTTLNYELVNPAFFATPADLEAWVKAFPLDSKYESGTFVPGGRIYVASDFALPSPAENGAVEGVGTFLVVRENTVMAWLSIECNLTERWILIGNWEDIQAMATLSYKEVLVNQAFKSHAALLYWIENSQSKSKQSDVTLSKKARLHVITNE